MRHQVQSRHLAQEACGDDGLGKCASTSAPFLPQGDEQPFRSALRHLDVMQQVLRVGERGGDSKVGGAETKKGGRSMLGGIAMATCHCQHCCSVLSTAHSEGVARANVQPATALVAAPSQPCHGLSTAGLLHGNLASRAILLHQQCFVHLLPSFAPHWGRVRQLLFADLLCLKA